MIKLKLRFQAKKEGLKLSQLFKKGLFYYAVSLQDELPEDLRYKAKILNKIMPLIQMTPVIGKVSEEVMNKVTAVIQVDREKRNSQMSSPLR